MIYVYASRTGNVAALIEKLRIEAMPISDGNERVEEDYILFTYTDGYGDIPMEVDTFLQNNPTHIKGVVCSGDTSLLRCRGKDCGDLFRPFALQGRDGWNRGRRQGDTSHAQESQSITRITSPTGTERATKGPFLFLEVS